MIFSIKKYLFKATIIDGHHIFQEPGQVCIRNYFIYHILFIIFLESMSQVYEELFYQNDHIFHIYLLFHEVEAPHQLFEQLVIEEGAYYGGVVRVVKMLSFCEVLEEKSSV